MATARVSQYDTNAVTEGVAETEVSQYDITVVFNFPSVEVRVSQYDVDVLTEAPSSPVMVSQYDMDVVYRGKVYNPKLRAWNFDLDGHENYVLRLGDGKTLVYDLSTEQWSWWSSGSKGYWRPSIGTNWTNSGSLPYGHGSNVVVGDDTFGIIGMLDPEYGVDDSTRAEDRAAGATIKFPRIATAQMTTRGRFNNPCYQVYLVGNMGRPAYTGATVTLSYSDDNGVTFSDAGAIPVVAGNYHQEIVWRSLGLIRTPGRIFRIEDDGAVPQIDELSVYDGDPTPE